MTARWAYPRYRESGLQWIPEVPDHWQIMPSWAIARQVRRLPSADEGVVTAFRDGQVTLRSNRRTEGFTEAIQEHGYQGVRRGELVIHSMDGFAGAVGVSDSDGKMSPVAHIYSIRYGEPRYFALLLRVMALGGFVESLAKGIRERSTAFDRAAFRSLSLPVPPAEEQRSILTFLDRETAQIDAFITKNEELIALLIERQTAGVAQAVIAGLNRSSETSVSEVDWLSGAGVPSHWETWKLGRLAKLQSGDFISAEEIEPEGAFPVYGGGGLRGYAATCNVRGEHAVIGRQGALCGQARLINGDFYATEHAVVVYPRRGVDLTWLLAILNAMNLGQYSVSAAQPGLSVDVISSKRLPVPPLSEQLEIGEHLRRVVMRTESALSVARRAIELARERRAALISAVVTGRINVGVAV